MFPGNSKPLPEPTEGTLRIRLIPPLIIIWNSIDDEQCFFVTVIISFLRILNWDPSSMALLNVTNGREAPVVGVGEGRMWSLVLAGLLYGLCGGTCEGLFETLGEGRCESLCGGNFVFCGVRDLCGVGCIPELKGRREECLLGKKS